MIIIKRNFKTWGFLLVSLITIFTACNKDVEQFADIKSAVPPSGPTLGETIAANADDSLYYRLIIKSGVLPLINNKVATFTMFVPGNVGMRLAINAFSGGLVPPGSPDAAYSGFISNFIPVETAAGIVSYNIIPQALPSAGIPAVFPNFQYPTLINPAPALSALLRLTTFPSTINGGWVNNIPFAGADITAANGIIHPTVFLVAPPQRFLWDRINTDSTLTYLKAAIIRADSGVLATNPSSLVGALNNIGANLTVFAPVDSAFRITLTGAIYQGLLPLVIQQLTAAYIGAGLTPEEAAAKAQTDAPPLAFSQAGALAATTDVFSNPVLYNVLTAQTVKGIVVYHILGTRAFTNNFPATATLTPTLLNGAIPTHPGVALKATISLPIVIAASVQGAFNATASNIIINPLVPDSLGTSDQHYVNGVIHKIDQVLIPLPL